MEILIGTDCISSDINDSHMQNKYLSVSDLCYFRLFSLGHHNALKTTKGPDFMVLLMSTTARGESSIEN